MTSSYEQEPMVELSHWSVYEVPLYGVDAPWTRHFVCQSPRLSVGRALGPASYVHSNLGKVEVAQRCSPPPRHYTGLFQTR